MKIKSSKFKIQSRSLKFKILTKIIHFGLLIVTLHFALCTLHLSQAHAQSINIGVNPALLKIEAVPPADVRTPFFIENLDKEPINLKVGYRLFKSSDKANGEIVFLTDKDPFPGANSKIFDNIQVIDDNVAIDTVELGPKQKKELVLRVILPKKEPYSDYYFSLIFLSTAQQPKTESGESEQNSFSAAQGGIAMNVLLSVGSRQNDKGYIEDFSGPFYVESGPYPFSLNVKNTGSNYITPSGTILIKNMFGQTIGKVEIAPDNILAGTNRFLTDKNSQQEIQDKPLVMWQEKFLLGFYNATLTLSMSEKGPVYSRTIHFVAFPSKLLLGIVIAIIILIFAFLRIRKGLSTE